MNLRIFLMITCFLATFGCGPNKKIVALESSSLKPLSVLFGRHISMNGGRPPADENAFKAFISSLPPSELQAFGVSDVNKLFVSERDQKPYVIKYGDSGPSIPGVPTVVVYEQEGVGGKRMIATSLGEVREVDAAEFQTLVGGAAS